MLLLRNWQWLRTNFSTGKAALANAQDAIKAIVNASSLVYPVLKPVSVSLATIVHLI